MPMSRHTQSASRGPYLKRRWSKTPRAFEIRRADFTDNESQIEERKRAAIFKHIRKKSAGLASADSGPEIRSSTD